MPDAAFQFRPFALDFRLPSEACFHAFKIHSLLRVSAPLRFSFVLRGAALVGTAAPEFLLKSLVRSVGRHDAALIPIL